MPIIGSAEHSIAEPLAFGTRTTAKLQLICIWQLQLRINLVRDSMVVYQLSVVVETAGLALHNEEPKRIFRPLTKPARICGSICAHAPIASSAASCLRPRRPSADALSSVISYSRVANPERRGSDAMNGAPNVACRRAFIRRSPGYSRHLGRTRQSGTLYRPTLRTL